MRRCVSHTQNHISSHDKVSAPAKSNYHLAAPSGVEQKFSLPISKVSTVSKVSEVLKVFKVFKVFKVSMVSKL